MVRGVLNKPTVNKILRIIDRTDAEAYVIQDIYARSRRFCWGRNGLPQSGLGSWTTVADDSDVAIYVTSIEGETVLNFLVAGDSGLNIYRSTETLPIETD